MKMHDHHQPQRRNRGGKRRPKRKRTRQKKHTHTKETATALLILLFFCHSPSYRYDHFHFRSGRWCCWSRVRSNSRQPIDHWYSKCPSTHPPPLQDRHSAVSSPRRRDTRAVRLRSFCRCACIESTHNQQPHITTSELRNECCMRDATDRRRTNGRANKQRRRHQTTTTTPTKQTNDKHEQQLHNSRNRSSLRE